MTEPHDLDKQPTEPDQTSAPEATPAAAQDAAPSPFTERAAPPPPPPSPPPPPPRFQPAGGPIAPGYGGPGYPPPPYYYGAPPAPAPKPRGPLRRFIGACGWIILIVLALVGLVTVFNREEGGSVQLASSARSVGLLRIEGVIMQGEQYAWWMDTLERFAEDDSLRGVVVRIDSPGGAVGASQELQAAVTRLRQEYGKTVYVSMGDIAASGGYYIASAADRIYALKGTLTGSIGVIFSKPNIGELTRKIGYETEIVKSGRFKDSMNMQRNFTPAERVMFDRLINSTYDQFLEDVLAWRSEPLGAAAQKLSSASWTAYQFTEPTTGTAATTVTATTLLREIADGRVYTGTQALELGLVDELGTLDHTILELGSELGIRGRPHVIEPQPKKSLREMLATSMAQAMSNALPEMREGLHYRMTLP